MSEIEKSIEETTENSYELRPLVASDMGAICKIITAIGIKEVRRCISTQDVKDIQSGKAKDISSIGIGVAFDLAGIVLANIPKAEEEIQSFVASLTGKKVAEIQNMPFADYGEIITKIIMKEDFRDFFKRVMKLFSR